MNRGKEFSRLFMCRRRVYGGYASLYIVFLAKLWLFHRFKLTLAFLWFLMFPLIMCVCVSCVLCMHQRA
jgi:hypothetical protein